MLRWLWLYAVLAPGCQFDPSGAADGAGAGQGDADSGAPVDATADAGADAGSRPVDAAPPDAPLRACATNPAYQPRPESSHSYLPVESGAAWADASDACNLEGAYLAVLDTEAESDFVRDLVAAGSFWIGLSDIAAEGDFVWVNGAPLEFENWANGEPNNFFGGEDCVEVNGDDALWNDEGCGDVKAYVCECGPDEPPTDDDDDPDAGVEDD